MSELLNLPQPALQVYQLFLYFFFTFLSPEESFSQISKQSLQLKKTFVVIGQKYLVAMSADNSNCKSWFFLPCTFVNFLPDIFSSSLVCTSRLLNPPSMLLVSTSHHQRVFQTRTLILPTQRLQKSFRQ